MRPLWWKHVTAYTLVPPPQHYPGHHLEAELKQQIQLLELWRIISYLSKAPGRIYVPQTGGERGGDDGEPVGAQTELNTWL